MTNSSLKTWRRLFCALALALLTSTATAAPPSAPQTTLVERRPNPLPGDPDMPEWGLRKGGTNQTAASSRTVAPSPSWWWRLWLIGGGRSAR